MNDDVNVYNKTIDDASSPRLHTRLLSRLAERYIGKNNFDANQISQNLSKNYRKKLNNLNN